MTAYDYDRQQWVEGDAARPLLVAQLRQELDILRGPRAAAFFAATRTPGMTSPADAISAAEARLAELKVS